MNPRIKRYLAATAIAVIVVFSIGAYHAFKLVVTGITATLNSIVQVRNVRVTANPPATQAEAAALEQKLTQNPHDLDARGRLIAYYWRLRLKSTDADAAYTGHVLWLIRNHPDDDLAGAMEMELKPGKDDAVIVQAKRAWQEQVSAHPTSAAIACNAGSFFLEIDRAKGVEFMRRAVSLEPNNPAWPHKIGEVSMNYMNSTTGDARRAAAKDALIAFEQCRTLGGDPTDESRNLDELSTAAFEAGDIVKAKTYGDQLLTLSRHSTIFFGDNDTAAHKGNLILGRIALRAGDLNTAKSCLLAAGRTTDSPTLDSFGPNMMLAKEMLEKGERQTVLDYFALCDKFWDKSCQNGALTEWAIEVKGGKIPDFGANLIY